MPRVALTTRLLPEGGEHGQPMVVMYAAYLRVLKRVGLTAVLVTPAHEADDAVALLDVCDGLVLSGGGDIAPEAYGEAPGPVLDEVVPERDGLELRVVEMALERELPILGICRGLQLLNVHFGGTLYQDLPSEYDRGVGHSQGEAWGKHQHEVRCTEGSRLHAALGGAGPIRINSYHHQAVKELGEGLVCTARAEDGLMEGIEATDYPWVVGVQWHPERHEARATDRDPNIRIMEAFALQVRERTG